MNDYYSRIGHWWALQPSIVLFMSNRGKKTNAKAQLPAWNWWIWREMLNCYLKSFDYSTVYIVIVALFRIIFVLWCLKSNYRGRKPVSIFQPANSWCFKDRRQLLFGDKCLIIRNVSLESDSPLPSILRHPFHDISTWVHFDAIILFINYHFHV